MEESPSNSYLIYLKSKIGESLENVLNTHLENGQITPECKQKFLEIFEEEMYSKIEGANKGKATIKGTVESFNFCDNIWTFKGKDMKIKIDKETYSNKHLKILAVESGKMKEEMSELVRRKMEERGEY